MVAWAKRVLTGVIVLPVLYLAFKTKLVQIPFFTIMYYQCQKEYLNILKNMLRILFAKKMETHKILEQYVDSVFKSKLQHLPSFIGMVILFIYDFDRIQFLLMILFLNIFFIVIFRILQYLKITNKILKEEEKLVQKLEKDQKQQTGKIKNDLMEGIEYEQNFQHQAFLIQFFIVSGELLCNVFFIFPFSYPLVFLNIENGPFFIILWLAIAFQSDNGALIVGKNKFCELISPSKTIEGVFGAVFVSTLSSLLIGLLQYQFYFIPQIPLIQFVIIGFFGGFFAVLGDFVESFIKRVAQVKDSGNFFPGHGGMMDRLDSLGFCAPFVFLYAHFVLHEI
ncbi:hypothetical protein PPERSA_04366 [Pseudocohnilembus persalinus]|uniref:Phosphatidate cytidylyltransferase n=1 Tax=Pseudocohnilembus persalinus TaxID=266149 RepID=A0A0V0QQZ5_PSEPJ|nr:hypothetical protein PPERSA_04366 [Pseudocohnilembus persalinus]|eukprot:KRX04551.1 hypothetical protein PPERSA_04366 [Pseudocohnilembus persalinus]